MYNETNPTEILHKILVKSMVISSYDPKISKSVYNFSGAGEHMHFNIMVQIVQLYSDPSGVRLASIIRTN